MTARRIVLGAVAALSVAVPLIGGLTAAAGSRPAGAAASAKSEAAGTAVAAAPQVVAAVTDSQPTARAAAAPRIRQMVVFRDGHALTRPRVSTAATTVRVAGRRCATGNGTALAALARSHAGRLRLRDFGACSLRPADAGGLLVTGIGADRNRGQRGWVYKVGHRAATAGAGDPGGPFGHGRLRARQRVTWFYCVRATDCQPTLEVRTKPTAGGIVAIVRGYDDSGDGVPVADARVSAGGVTGLTAADGRVQLALSSGPHRVIARKDGLVRSFTELVEVP